MVAELAGSISNSSAWLVALTRKYRLKLVITRELGLGDRQALDGAEQLSFEAGKMLAALLKKLA
jgi:hypothetical protein